jgi:hypothetical protein
MRKLTVLLVLSAILGIGTRAEAQFSYTVENVNQIYQPLGSHYDGGFTATLLFENVNTYDDPSIITFRSFRLAVSSRVMNYCALYDLARDWCNLSGSQLGIQGNVQTGTIPIGGSAWIYDPFVSEDSCIQFCYAKRYDLDAGFGVLGCQAPAPTPDFYAGRTCDADGFTGFVSMNVTFRYLAPADVPVFVFDATDLEARATNFVVRGPNVFGPVPAPEPSSWLLMATGLGFVGGAVGRRKGAMAGAA